MLLKKRFPGGSPKLIYPVCSHICNDLHCPSYILTSRNGSGLHLRAHCVLEVTFRNGEYVEAISLPPMVTTYVVMGLLSCSFGHVLEGNCRILLNGHPLTEELTECQTGHFLQVDVFRVISERVAVDLRRMLCRHLWRVHLPINTLTEGRHLLQLFVPRGGTPFSGALITSVSSLENWNSALLQVARLAFPVRDPEMMRFYQAHHSFEQVQPQANVVFSFILGDLDELDDDTCVIVITVNTREAKTTGACMWPKSTSIWRLFDVCLTGRPWTVYHNNQRLNHRNVLVNNGDYFACYEKTPSLQELSDPSNVAEVGQFGYGLQGVPASDSLHTFGFSSVRPLLMPKSSPPLPRGSGAFTYSDQPLNYQNEGMSTGCAEVTERQALLARSPFGNPLDLQNNQMVVQILNQFLLRLSLLISQATGFDKSLSLPAKFGTLALRCMGINRILMLWG